MSLEPQLQSLDGEMFNHRTANTELEARLDIRVHGFWKDADFDVRVFHPNASNLALVTCLESLSQQRTENTANMCMM